METSHRKIFSPFLELWAVAVLVSYFLLGPRHLLTAETWATYIPPLWRMQISALAVHTDYLSQLGVFWIFSAGLGRILLRSVFCVPDLNRLEGLAFSLGL